MAACSKIFRHSARVKARRTDSGASVRVIGTLGVIAVVVLDLGIYAVVAVSGVASLWGLCQLALRFRQISSVHLRDWPWTARQIVRAGLPFVSVFGALVLYQQVDVIVISFAASDTELGWYSASDILFGSLLFPATVTMGVLFPTLGRRFAEDPQMLDELVEHVIVIGEARPFLTALIVPNQVALDEFCQTQGMHQNDPDLLPALLARLKQDLDNHPRFAQIHRVALLDEPWTTDNHMLTPTHKPRRRHILQRYAERIDALYRGHFSPDDTALNYHVDIG